MKSAMLAGAALATAASAHMARAPLDLGVKVADLLDVKVCLGLDVHLPLGISVESAGCPDGPPAGDQIDTWHPPHHVPMDDCDDNDNEQWHYVRPCGCTAHAPHAWGTSTVFRAVTGGPTTVVVPATTYICPVPVADKPVADKPVANKAVAPPPAVTDTQCREESS
ncbi:hypothetical protein E4U53_003415, partial [Claviceps sorghi]